MSLCENWLHSQDKFGDYILSLLISVWKAVSDVFLNSFPFLGNAVITLPILSESYSIIEFQTRLVVC